MKVITPKKLIEVALPLDDINTEAAREKSIRHGHPSTLHLWWARRPLAAARAVIFAQLVNDPSWRWELESPGKAPPQQLKASWAASRKRLFTLIRELVKWENSQNAELLAQAHAEILKSWRETCEVNATHPDAATLFDPKRLPGLHDPFAGGGTIPLEAQRLGLDAYATDLNPVAVLINKAMIEIPPRFKDRPPVHPDAQAEMRTWRGAQGLAEDVRRYGAWMRDEALKRVGHLYPPLTLTPERVEDRPDLKPLVGKELTVIAWLWARTVKSPSPAFRHVDVPLASSFVLATKPGKEAWVEPVVTGDAYRLVVRRSIPPEHAKEGTKASGRGAEFRCVLSGAAIGGDYIKEEAKAGRMGQRLMAIVCEGERQRIYVSPMQEDEDIATSARPGWRPDGNLPNDARAFTPILYGVNSWWQLFSERQLSSLDALTAIVSVVRERVYLDAKFQRGESPRRLDDGGTEAIAYADTIGLYLTLAVGKLADNASNLCGWHNGASHEKIRATFGRQALSMTWDYAEGNPFSASSGNYYRQVSLLAEVVDRLGLVDSVATANQEDAGRQTTSLGRVVSTDPPYYDNVPYADLSDFFYVWLRRALRPVFPDLFATVAVPKAEELVASNTRHGDKRKAEHFFLSGMTQAMHQIAIQAHPAAPITIYYAFKQAETKGKLSADEGTVSTGWETFLQAVLQAGLSVTGTWPMRTELGNRMRSTDSNALASSIVLVCRRRPDDAPVTSRREFIRELNAALPLALAEMTRGEGGEYSPVAPVDLSQAIIGPGMAIFSKYKAVLDADAKPLGVKAALQLINRYLNDDDFDADTRFCLAWFDEHRWGEGPFGGADVLARSKATSVGGLVEAGVLRSASGRVRLLRPAEYPDDWSARLDERQPTWEVLHQLIRALRKEGEQGAAAVLRDVGGRAESARQLAYRLYTLCERDGLAEDARPYNELVSGWTGIEQAIAEPDVTETQLPLPWSPR